MKKRDYALFILGSAIIYLAKLDIIAHQGLSDFIKGVGYSFYLYFLLKVIYFKLFKLENNEQGIGLANKDYITFILGSVIIIVGYMFSFTDPEIADFLRGMGNTLVLLFVVKSIYKLITKYKHETT